MMGLLKYPDDFSKSVGMNQLWYKDTTTTASIANNTGFNVRHSYLIESPVPKGTFSFRIPLKHIFGFCEDYDKIVYGMKHTLTLVRKSNDDAIFRDNAMAVGKIVLDKVSWFMPHVTPSDTEKYQLYKMIESKVTLPVAYRMRQCESVSVSQSTNFTWRLAAKTAPEKPRYIIIGFQTGKSGNQEENPAIFDNVDVCNMYATLNSTRYPAVDYNMSFPKQQFSRAYGDVAAFRSKFFITWMNSSVILILLHPTIKPYILSSFLTSVGKVND